MMSLEMGGLPARAVRGRCTLYRCSQRGRAAARGERGALVVNLLRMSSNPFFPYLLGRIEEGIDAGAPELRAAE